MSTFLERRLRRRQLDEAGFTLVEVLVAITIVAVIGAAMLPLLATGIKAARKAKLETQAKSLTQLRIERMRNLPFHVDRQNGPFIDLLDLYYTDTNTAVTTRADGTRVRWIANNTAGGGTPTGPTYHMHIPSVSGFPSFSLDIYTQFLRTTHTVATVPLTYNSQVDGMDQPPSNLLGITIFTRHRDSNGTRSYRTYTEVAEGVRTAPLITTQANAQALRISSNQADGSTLQMQVGNIVADGSLTSGSTASMQGEAARTEATGVEEWLGAVAAAFAPPNPGSTTGSNASRPAVAGSGGGSCGWSGFGKSQIENYSANTAGGYPIAPANAGNDVRSGTATQRTRSGLVRNGGGCGGYMLYYRNSLAEVSADPYYDLAAGPRAFMLDPNSSGFSVSGNAAITASDPMTTPLFSSARAGAAVVDRLRLLPTNTWTDGLVKVMLNSASITCVSNAPVSAAYSLTVEYPGGSRTVVLSGGTVTGSLPDPASVAFTTSTGQTRTLSEYLSWQTAAGASQGANGVHSLGPVLRLNIRPEAVGNGGITVDVGTLSCAASDNR